MFILVRLRAEVSNNARSKGYKRVQKGGRRWKRVKKGGRGWKRVEERL